MGEAKRKTYTAAFKAKVGLEAIRGVRTVNEIGQEYGVHPAQVGQWKKEILEQAGTLFEKKRGPKQVDGAGEPDRLGSHWVVSGRTVWPPASCRWCISVGGPAACGWSQSAAR